MDDSDEGEEAPVDEGEVEDVEAVDGEDDDVTSGGAVEPYVASGANTDVGGGTKDAYKGRAMGDIIAKA